MIEQQLGVEAVAKRYGEGMTACNMRSLTA